jgi:hypothetical protein
VPQGPLLGKLLERFGYDTRIGPLGSFTYAEDRDNPLAVTANLPFQPGYVRVPQDRELSEEEIAHEGSHVQGGLPGSMLSTLLSGAAGLGAERGLIGPDEVMATLTQPKTETTKSDLSVIRQMAEATDMNDLYKALLKRLTKE